MNSTRIKITAILAAIIALVLAPATAHADYQPTSPQGDETWTTPGATLTVDFINFEANESVNFVLTGEDAADATLASIKMAVNSASLTKSADSDGNVSVTVTLPSTATGTYTLDANAASGSSQFLINVSEDGTPGGGDDSTSTDPDQSGLLTRTDGDISTGVLVIGGLLLAAGVGILLVARRKRGVQES